ncbi:MAG: ABC transporter permease [Gemmataceae bacterium]
MRLGTLILKNITRRPLRSALTVLAIAIAIGSVVSLVGVANGFEETFRSIYKRKGVDLIVVRAGSAQKLGSTLPLSLYEKILKVNGVKDAIPGLVDAVAIGDIPTVVLQGWIPGTVVFDHLTVLQGRMLHTGDKKAVMLGTVLARNLGKKVGDRMQIIDGGPEFEVVGIHETHNVFENGALVLPLPELQDLIDKKDKVTGYSIILDEEAKKADPELISKVRAQVETLEKNISALPSQDHVGALTEIKVVKAMAWITSAIALAIGLFGVMNTMVMAVSERTREIGILRAVGWRPKSVLRLVLFEAVVLSLAGAVVGILGSVVLLKLLTLMPMVAGLIDSNINPVFFVYGVGIAFAVGLVGGIIPARRRARMLPTAAATAGVTLKKPEAAARSEEATPAGPLRAFPSHVHRPALRTELGRSRVPRARSNDSPARSARLNRRPDIVRSSALVCTSDSISFIDISWAGQSIVTLVGMTAPVPRSTVTLWTVARQIGLPRASIRAWPSTCGCPSVAWYLLNTVIRLTLSPEGVVESWINSTVLG